MSDYKHSLTPFQSSVKLIVDCDSPLVDSTLYHQLMESLIYLTLKNTYPSFVVNMIFNFMQKPHESNWKETNMILKYLHGTVHYGVSYSSKSIFLVFGYTYTD